LKAVLCKAFGSPEALAIENVPAPAVGDNQVGIAVYAAGLNFPDILLVEGKYQGRPPLPFSPGLEVAGVVTQMGSSVGSFAIGQRVVASTGGHGGFAEDIAVDADRVYPISDALSFEAAAAVPVTYSAAYHALVDRGRLKAGEWLLVHGAGSGVGLCAVELGKHLGARVIAAAGSPEKLVAARRYGADELLNYHELPEFSDKVKEITGADGADVIFDPVGGEVFGESTRCINWRGRLLVVGFASGVIPQLAVNRALLKGCDVVGVFNGAFMKREPRDSRANYETLLRWVELGKLRPLISQRFPLDRIAEAMAMLSSRKVIGKVIINVRAA
jgi:NADPH:quinone reductase